MQQHHNSAGSTFGRQAVGLAVGLAAIALLSTVGSFSGYYAGDSIGRFVNWLSRPANKSSPAARESTEPGSLFADWPQQPPDLALLITGEWLGHMRPCGCSENQQGGLAHLGELKRYLNADRGWQVLGIDLGDLVGPDPNAETEGGEIPLIDRRSNARIDLIKYHYIVEALRKLDYAAIGVGLGDLRIGANEVVGEAINLQNTKLLAANFGYSEPDFESVLKEVVKSAHIVEVGGVKIGVCSVIAARPDRKIPDDRIRLGAESAAIGACAELFDKQNVDLRVLLAHADSKEAASLANRFAKFDLVVCASELDDPSRNDIRRVNGALVVWGGRKGKWALVAGYWKNQTEKLQIAIVPLDNRFGEMEAMNELYAKFVKAAKDDELLEKSPRVKHKSGLGYVGAEKCGECHKKAYAKWKESKHSHAMESLVAYAKPQGQQFNPECVSCHSTGFRFTGGFISLEKTPHLAGNQCENCHGPGEKHANDGMDGKDPEHIRPLKLSRSNVAKTCYQCHDKDNSPKFEFESYFQKIIHPWKD